MSQQIGPYTLVTDSLNTSSSSPSFSPTSSPSSPSVASPRSRLYPGYDSNTGTRVVINSVRSNSEDTVRKLVQLSFLEHENWAKVLHVARQGDVVYVVGEDRAWNLESYCKSENPGLDERVMIMKQCAAGLCFLHSLPEPLLHGNLSPQNILIKRSELHSVAKLCDPLLETDRLDPDTKKGGRKQHFPTPNLYSSLSPDLSAPNLGNSPQPDISVPNESDVSPFSNPDYLAPELLASGYITKETDVFAMGVIFFRLLLCDSNAGVSVKQKYGGSLYTLAECLEELHKQDLHWSPVQVCLSDPPHVLKLKALISSMLQYQASERPSAQEVLKVLAELTTERGLRNPGCMMTMEEGMSTSDEEDDVEMVPVAPLTNGLSDKMHVEHLKTLTFENEVWTGFGYDGECIIAARYENALGHIRDSLTCYKLTQAPTTFQHLWRKPMPPGVSIKCSKFVTKSGNILLHEKGTTMIYNNRMQNLKKHGATTTNNNKLSYGMENRISAIHLDSWYLCDSLDGVLAVRDLQSGELQHRIRVQRGHREDFRSIVCCNPETGFTAVACAEMSSIEIFNREGASLMTQSLPYRPCHMSSSARHLLVAQWGPAPVLHVHAWSASGCRHVSQLGPRRLGLASSERICGMSPLLEDGVVILAVWCRKRELDRVVAYKITFEDDDSK